MRYVNLIRPKVVTSWEVGAEGEDVSLGASRGALWRSSVGYCFKGRPANTHSLFLIGGPVCAQIFMFSLSLASEIPFFWLSSS